MTSLSTTGTITTTTSRACAFRHLRSGNVCCAGGVGRCLGGGRRRSFGRVLPRRSSRHNIRWLLQAGRSSSVAGLLVQSTCIAYSCSLRRSSPEWRLCRAAITKCVKICLQRYGRAKSHTCRFVHWVQQQKSLGSVSQPNHRCGSLGSKPWTKSSEHRS